MLTQHIYIYVYIRIHRDTDTYHLFLISFLQNRDVVKHTEKEFISSDVFSSLRRDNPRDFMRGCCRATAAYPQNERSSATSYGCLHSLGDPFTNPPPTLPFFLPSSLFSSSLFSPLLPLSYLLTYFYFVVYDDIRRLMVVIVCIIYVLKHER